MRNDITYTKCVLRYVVWHTVMPPKMKRRHSLEAAAKGREILKQARLGIVSFSAALPTISESVTLSESDVATEACAVDSGVLQGVALLCFGEKSVLWGDAVKAGLWTKQDLRQDIAMDWNIEWLNSGCHFSGLWGSTILDRQRAEQCSSLHRWWLELGLRQSCQARVFMRNLYGFPPIFTDARMLVFRFRPGFGGVHCAACSFHSQQETADCCENVLPKAKHGKLHDKLLKQFTSTWQLC